MTAKAEAKPHPRAKALVAAKAAPGRDRCRRVAKVAEGRARRENATALARSFRDLRPKRCCDAEHRARQAQLCGCRGHGAPVGAELASGRLMRSVAPRERDPDVDHWTNRMGVATTVRGACSCCRLGRALELLDLGERSTALVRYAFAFSRARRRGLGRPLSSSGCRGRSCRPSARISRLSRSSMRSRASWAAGVSWIAGPQSTTIHKALAWGCFISDQFAPGSSSAAISS